MVDPFDRSGASLLKKAEQVAQLLGTEFLVERFGHQGYVRLLQLLDLRPGDPGALAFGVAEGDHLGRLLDDQAAQDAAVLGRDDCTPGTPCGRPRRVDQADEQEVAIVPVGVGQVGTDRLSLAIESMAGGASVVKELSSPRGVAGAGPQVVVQPPDLGEPLFARRAPGHAPVLADQRGEFRDPKRRERPSWSSVTSLAGKLASIDRGQVGLAHETRLKSSSRTPRTPGVVLRG